MCAYVCARKFVFVRMCMCVCAVSPDVKGYGFSGLVRLKFRFEWFSEV